MPGSDHFQSWVLGESRLPVSVSQLLFSKPSDEFPVVAVFVENDRISGWCRSCRDPVSEFLVSCKDIWSVSKRYSLSLRELHAAESDLERDLFETISGV